MPSSSSQSLSSNGLGHVDGFTPSVWQPSFHSFNHLIIITNTVLEDEESAMVVANSFTLPCDQERLEEQTDDEAVNHALLS